MEKLRIEYIALENLTPDENNARKHGEDDVEAIKQSIEEFGMNDPIGVWGERNIIVEGHGRLLALKELGYTEAPCVRLDRMTEKQRKAYALAHNKTAELSGWDFEQMEANLAELSESLDMTKFGFVVNEDVNIDDFFMDATETKEKEPKKIQCPHCGEFFEV